MQPLTKTLSTFSCLKIGVALMLSLAFSSPVWATSWAWTWGSPNTKTASTSVDSNNYRPTINTDLFSSCAIRDDKELVCWGGSYLGRTPTLMGLSDVRSVAMGGWYDVCAVTGAGKVYCVRGIGNPLNEVPEINNAVSVLINRLHNYCAVLSTGRVKCWEAPYSPTNLFTLPVDVPNLLGVVSLSEGANDSLCALTFAGAVYCWKSTDTNITTQQIQGVTSVRQVQSSDLGICLLLSNTKVYCAPTSKALDFANYVEVSGINNAKSIYVSGGEVCIDNSDTTIKCFNFEGGAVSEPFFTKPVTSLLADNAQLAFSVGHVCAVDQFYAVSCMSLASTGNLKCSRDDVVASCNNFMGELGVPKSTPVESDIWYTIPNFTAYKAGKPTMFTAPARPTRYTRDSTSIWIAWPKVANDTSTDFDVRYRVAGTSSWKTASGRIVNGSGSRFVIPIMDLTPNTSYEFKVRGKNWASYTNYSSVLTTSTLP